MNLDSQHFLQSAEWAEINLANGWKSLYIENNGIVRGFRKITPLGGVIFMPGYLPNSKTDLQKLTSELYQLKGNDLVAKLETCSPRDPAVEEWLKNLGWKKSRITQYSHTVYFDLSKSEEILLKEMKSRARYEVNSAIRQGIEIKEVSATDQNLEAMFALLQDTSRRKKFTVRDKSFIFKMWRAFRDSSKLRLFFAYHDLEIVAGAIILTDGHTAAWYKYGGSNPAKSKLFGARLLVFEIAKILKKDGFKTLDLGGIPDPTTYETSHMRGIYIFKTGYSNEITEMMPAYELPLNKIAYKLWPKLELAYLKQAKLRSKMWY